MVVHAMKAVQQDHGQGWCLWGSDTGQADLNDEEAAM